MTAGDGERLLNYALPVLRFLGVRRVRFPRHLMSESVPPFDRSYFEPGDAYWPAPEGLWGAIVRGAARLLLDGGHGTEFILDVQRSGCWVGEEHSGPSDPSWRTLAP